MAIKGMQQRFTQVGVIRLGKQEPLRDRPDKTRPAKLDTFRFTSPSQSIIEAVAATYGGQVQPWQSNTGPQWEVITEAKSIQVMVPPQKIDPNMEHWGNGYRDRLCDGETEQIRRKPCFCAAAAAAGRPFGPRDVCKPTTRLSLMLAEILTLGTFKLESHGWNAAAELPMLAASIASAPQPVPARLEIQVREKKAFDPDAAEGKQVEPRVYMVPVLIFDWMTPAQAFGGELGAAARQALAGRATEQKALAAAGDPAHRRFTPQQYIDLADEVDLAGGTESLQRVRELWVDAAHDKAGTPAVEAKLKAVVAEIERRMRAPAPPSPPAVPEPAGNAVDAEVEPDPDEVFTEIMAEAGARGWTSEDVEHRIQQHLKRASDEANGFELTRFLDAVKNGEIQ